MLMEEVFERLRKFQDILKERVAIEKEIRGHSQVTRGPGRSPCPRQEGICRKERRASKPRRTRVAELRNELAEAEASREHAEKQMDSISTQREYEALNKEITRRHGQGAPGPQGPPERGTVAGAEIEESVKSDESMIELQETEIKEKKRKIHDETSHKQKRVEELRGSEKTTTDDIDTEIIFKFERIIRSKQGFGIVPVRGCLFRLLDDPARPVRQRGSAEQQDRLLPLLFPRPPLPGDGGSRRAT